MVKQKCFETLNEIAKYEHGWDKLGVGNSFSPLLLERCRRMLEKMTVVPKVRPTIEDTIAFDFETEKMFVEILVSDDMITGFIPDPEDNTSEFIFETETDAVNFCNTVVGAALCKGCSCGG